MVDPSTPRVAVISAAAKGWRAQNSASVRLLAAAGARAVFIGINDVGCVHPDPMPHWASLHIDQLVTPGHEWAKQREANGLTCEYTRWSQTHGGQVDHVASRQWRGGSSGLLALDVALNNLRCDGAILCGIPLDARPNEMNAMWKRGWGEFKRFRFAWEEKRAEFADRTRSWSGWTRDMLGEPTLEWVHSLTYCR